MAYHRTTIFNFVRQTLCICFVYVYSHICCVVCRCLPLNEEVDLINVAFEDKRLSETRSKYVCGIVLCVLLCLRVSGSILLLHSFVYRPSPANACLL